MSKHRAPRRKALPATRVAFAALALGLTVVVGGTAAAVLPQLVTGSASADQSAATRDATPSALETATIEPPAPAATPDAPALQADVSSQPDPAVPAASGEGRRIVFSQSDQRVWLVAGDGTVERTYLVSGSRFDNLDPGSYRVQSKTRDATAFDASGTMEYFVRFATGYSEPIGFHSVPRDNAGRLEQTKAQLGTPLSAGCVRQWKNDAVALWEFAPVGTPVVVTA
ncbi:L,D-transpeptidase [Aeromicrobium endophyticum]|uniref:L,D-transpeptidase n=1 Tax=Aeromicrobium endophyticum TaxID=2292704 RepID=UPI0013148888|nr:L,D-transpeptidase [Aeromicrobium endophyticum]